MAKRPAIVFYCCFLLVGLARAQPTSPDAPRPTQPQGSSQGQRLPQGERPLSLSGRVLYEDGSPADVTARVELICDGQVRRQAHTLDGHFHLVVDGSNIHGAAMDASVASQDALGGVNSSRTAGLGLGTTGQSSQGGQFLGTSGPGHADLSGCELRASQVGFQSDSILLTLRRPLENPDVGVIVLYRGGSIVGTTTSVTTMSAPKKARQAYQKARKEIKKNKNYQQALVNLQTAIDLYPEFSVAWELLGQLRLGLNDESGARKALESAVASDPMYLLPQVTMMELEFHRENWDQVRRWSTQVLELNPHLVSAHYHLGLARIHLRRIEEAEESLTRVKASYKADDYPFASYMLGFLLANKGSFDAAAREQEHFLKLKPEAPERREGEGVSGRMGEERPDQGRRRAVIPETWNVKRETWNSIPPPAAQKGQNIGCSHVVEPSRLRQTLHPPYRSQPLLRGLIGHMDAIHRVTSRTAFGHHLLPPQ